MDPPRLWYSRGMPDLPQLAARWRADLAAWAIPEEIRARAVVDPWGHVVARFATRTDARLAAPGGPTHERIVAALPAGGTLLDVGAGTGAASVPAARARHAHLIAVDENPAMLAELRRIAPRAETIEGRWPDVADRVPVADVAVCAHVVFNVPDLPEFFTALTAHARRRVVVELPERHPMSWQNPLWEHFHGLRRPTRPTAADAADIARALGYDVVTEISTAPDDHYESVERMAESACRRLCLPPDRREEVAKVAIALGVWPLPRQRWFTLSWDTEPSP